MDVFVTFSDNFSFFDSFYLFCFYNNSAGINPTTLGYGLENISSAFSSYFGRFNVNTLNSASFHGLKNLVVDRSHNYTLDLLFFSGILGFLAWIVLVWQLFRKIKSKVLLASLIIYLVWIQLQIQSVVHLMYFWLLVGLIDQEDSWGLDEGGVICFY